MKGIEVEPPYQESASRIELLYRFGYFIVYYIVILIFSFVIMFSYPLQWLSILVLGKRQKILNNVNLAFMEYVTECAAYFYMLTDERPRLYPDIDSITKK